MTYVQSFFPSKYLKGSDMIEPEAEVIIVDAVVEEVTGANTQTEEKLVLVFDRPVGKSESKRLILNKTNAMTIATVLESDDVDDWPDRQITLVREMWQGTPCVRVKQITT